MPDASSNQNRGYSAAHFTLQLEGFQAGILKSIEGGAVHTEVMTYQGNGGPPPFVRYRQLGKPKYDDIKITAGMAVSEKLFQWISDFFSGSPTRKDGAIIASDFYYKERARRTFTNALIKEFTFPKLEGSDKGPAYMTVTLAVEDIQFSTKQQGQGDAILDTFAMQTQKSWKACNFKFEIDGAKGIAGAAKRVMKIDSFTVKQNIAEYHMGGFLAPTKTPTVVDTPNLVFYVPEADAQPFFDACTNNNGLAVKNNATPSPVHGRLVVCDNSMAEVFQLEFSQANIFSVTPDRSDSTSEEIKQVKVEVYTEIMKFKYLLKPSPTVA
ncbi:MAG TPA: phage tail protein [Kofleriaceae bacterium]|nr:phage tail protein [Kofleriaceae bacterium]